MWRQRSVEQRVANVSHVLARGAVRKPNLPDSVWSSATSRGNKCVKEICKQDKTEKRSSATTETRSDHKLTSAFVMMASDEFCTAEEGCQVQNWYIQSQNQQSACRRKARHTPIHALKHTHTHTQILNMLKGSTSALQVQNLVLYISYWKEQILV